MGLFGLFGGGKKKDPLAQLEKQLDRDHFNREVLLEEEQVIRANPGDIAGAERKLARVCFSLHLSYDYGVGGAADAAKAQEYREKTLAAVAGDDSYNAEGYREVFQVFDLPQGAADRMWIWGFNADALKYRSLIIAYAIIYDIVQTPDAERILDDYIYKIAEIKQDNLQIQLSRDNYQKYVFVSHNLEGWDSRYSGLLSDWETVVDLVRAYYKEHNNTPAAPARGSNADYYTDLPVMLLCACTYKHYRMAGQLPNLIVAAQGVMPDLGSYATAYYFMYLYKKDPSLRSSLRHIVIEAMDLLLPVADGNAALLELFRCLYNDLK